MATSEESDIARFGAAMIRMERRIEEMATSIERQGTKLDLLLARTTPEEPEEGQSLRELLAELVRLTTEHTVLLKRIHGNLE